MTCITCRPWGRTGRVAIFRPGARLHLRRRTLEEQRMTGFPSRRMLKLAALTLTGTLAACGGKDHSAASRDTTAAMSADSAAPAGAAGPTKVEGFQAPESAKYDAELDVWYRSEEHTSELQSHVNLVCR